MKTLQPKNATHNKYKHHCGMTPFIHDGVVIESYQLLNQDNQAVVSVTLYDGQIESMGSVIPSDEIKDWLKQLGIKD